MIHRSLSRRTGVASRAALGLALALGVAAGGAVSTPAFAQKYCDAIFADAAFREWERAGEVETWTIEQSEALYR